MDKNEKSIDERLEFLLKSTESLHSNMELLIEENRKSRKEADRREAKFQKYRMAMLLGIQKFLEELGNEDKSA